MKREPEIWVDGVKLTVGQALTVRVAVTVLEADMSTAQARAVNGKVADGYRDRSREVLKIMGVIE